MAAGGRSAPAPARLPRPPAGAGRGEGGGRDGARGSGRAGQAGSGGRGGRDGGANRAPTSNAGPRRQPARACACVGASRVVEGGRVAAAVAPRPSGEPARALLLALPVWEAARWRHRVGEIQAGPAGASGTPRRCRRSASPVPGAPAAWALRESCPVTGTLSPRHPQTPASVALHTSPKLHKAKTSPFHLSKTFTPARAGDCASAPGEGAWEEKAMLKLVPSSMPRRCSLVERCKLFLSWKWS